MATFIIMLGPPGAGKGTQAKILAESLELVHVSTGELFRALKSQDTDFAREVLAIMARGELVPDDVTVRMVKERIAKPDCENGAIFDGFPRTIAQADALAGMLAADFSDEIDVVLQIQVTEDEIVRRITGRAVESKAAGNPVREDDTPEGARKRYQVYLESTEPLIDYYQERDKIVEVDGMRAIEDITPDLCDEIRARVGSK